jgi:hypothetical protein
MSAAPVITCGNSYNDTTIGGTSVMPGGTSLEKVYRITLTATTLRPIILETCTHGFDSLIRVFGPTLTQLAVNDDHGGRCSAASGATSVGSHVVWTPPAGAGTYYVSVEGYATRSGTFTLTTNCGAPSAALATALRASPTLACGASDTSTTVGGTSVLSIGAAPERIYRIVVTAATPRPLTISTCVSSFDSYIRLFDSVSLSTLVHNYIWGVDVLKCILHLLYRCFQS